MKCKFIFFKFQMFVSLQEEWFAGKIEKYVNFMETKTITIPATLKSFVSNL